jgi:hypothetical protein
VEINDENPQLHPSGFIDLGIFNQDEDGSFETHAIGCKIDHQVGLYRFWDPNYGIYQVGPEGKFDDFRNAFQAFLDQNYPGWKPYSASEVYPKS